MSKLIPFENEKNVLGKALFFEAITPHDTVNLGVAVRMIYVGTGGDVSLVDSMGQVGLHKNVPSGAYLGPFTVVRVNATGTTASDFVGYV